MLVHAWAHKQQAWPLVADVAAIQERMQHIRHKILVLSGKGGVGKSTFSAQLAFALAATGAQVRPSTFYVLVCVICSIPVISFFWAKSSCRDASSQSTASGTTNRKRSKVFEFERKEKGTTDGCCCFAVTDVLQSQASCSYLSAQSI